jgi:hypothetical protein
MKEYQERAVKEQEALQMLVTKLETFINGGVFLECSRSEQSRLKEQLVYMRAYLDVLNQRIANFEK